MTSYNTYFNQWIQYCTNKNLDYVHVAVADGLEFLQFLFDQDTRGYSAMNSARSALSQIVKLTDSDLDFGKHPDVVRFMSGIFNLKPSVPKYVEIWNPDDVLKLFLAWSPASRLSLKLLTIKTLVLFLLVTGQRTQVIQYVNITDMKISKNAYQFYLRPQELKQGRPNYIPEALELRKYPSNKKLCVYHYLTVYLERTLDIRGAEKSLFLTLSDPHKKPTQDTVSRWVKTVLRHAGIDTKAYSAGSVRSASASKAKRAGVPVDSILTKGGWTQASTFRKYYDKPVLRSNKFAEGVLSMK